MNKLQIPKNYKNKLDLISTEKAIKFVKDNFERLLAKSLNLTRVSAPILVLSDTGINDDLNGVERTVRFYVLGLDGQNAEIVHSLAKWKRTALKKYGFSSNSGLYTDMNAIRRDDNMDNIHSIYVDQWDWERVIEKSQRNVRFLKSIVRKIVNAIYKVNELTKKAFPELSLNINKDVVFITAKQAEKLYPNLSSKEREHALAKEFGTVFLMGIGSKLKSGKPHDGRAPDYDDWKLNGDLLVYNEVLGESLELSSMGVRVDEISIVKQLKERKMLEKLNFDYHKQIVEKKLPLTIGGGIGQSRLCMYILQKAHIGEVQVSLWPQGLEEEAKKGGIDIL